MRSFSTLSMNTDMIVSRILTFVHYVDGHGPIPGGESDTLSTYPRDYRMNNKVSF